MAIKRLTIRNDVFSDNNVANTILGLAGNDTIRGFGGNDILDGGIGSDMLYGGTGNDRFLVERATDRAFELSGQGIDTVAASLNWTLGANIENLVLTGNAVSGTGNTLANTITGNAKANVLNGGGGADRLNGGLGADNMFGGAGNDVYTVDNTGDRVTDTSDVDTVLASITYTLGAAIENLTLTGAGAINGTGNASANQITGNSGANTLVGGDGNDTILGGAGNDVIRGGKGRDIMTGGAGADRFVLSNYTTDATADSGTIPLSNSDVSALDIIMDFNPAEGDQLDLREMVGSTGLGASAPSVWRENFTFLGPFQPNGTFEGQFLVRSFADYTILYFDRDDGNNAVDFAIALKSPVSLTGNWFLDGRDG